MSYPKCPTCGGWTIPEKDWDPPREKARKNLACTGKENFNTGYCRAFSSAEYNRFFQRINKESSK